MAQAVNKDTIAEERGELSLSRKFRSPVWGYFHLDKETARCKQCDKIYNLPTDIKTAGTSHLRYHLEKKHPEITGIIILPKASESDTDHAVQCVKKWVVETDQSFTAIEHPSFKQMLLSMNPKNPSIANSVPQSARIMKELLLASYESEFERVKTICKDINGQVSYTLDAWTSNNRLPFLGVTMHWIDVNWELHNKLLGFIPFSERHTGKNICSTFVNLIRSTSLKVLAITMDNALNNDTFTKELETKSEELGIRFSAETRVRCFAHVLNLAVQDLLKHLKSEPQFDDESDYEEAAEGLIPVPQISIGNSVAKIRGLVLKIRLSNQKETHLSNLSSSFGLDDLKVVLDVKTRWNSTYAMLSRAIYLKPSLEAIIRSDAELRKFSLIDVEWDNLEKLLVLLKDFELATKMFSSSQYPTISAVLPAYYWLVDKLGKDHEDIVINDACVVAKEKLLKYLEMSHIDAFWISIVVDPTLKMDFVQSNFPKAVAKNIKSKVLAVFNQYYENSIVTSVNMNTSEDTAGILAYYPKRPMRLAKGSELLKYLKDDLQPPKTNVLQWWKANEDFYPGVSNMARDFLAIPATSVPVEQIFSSGSNLVTPKRGRLSSDTISHMMCLKRWWKDTGNIS